MSDASSSVPTRAAMAHWSEDQLGELITAAQQELAHRATVSAFEVLISLSASLGQSTGDAARRVAETGSWSQVAAVSGTSKQAAWSRWR